MVNIGYVYITIPFSKVPVGVNFRARGYWFIKLGRYSAINKDAENNPCQSFIRPETVGILYFPKNK